MIGTNLGHYRILRLLRKGGIGEVYAAEDLTLGRTVAIKVLPPRVEGQPADLERFAREAKSIAALNHRGIVTLHSFEESDDKHFITMELVESAPGADRRGVRAQRRCRRREARRTGREGHGRPRGTFRRHGGRRRVVAPARGRGHHAHDLRGDDAQGRTCGERPAASGDRDGQLPHFSWHRSRGCAGDS